MRYQPAELTGLAMLLDAALLVVLATQRSSALRHHNRQVTAARQTLTHLQAAYDRIAPAALAQIGAHRPADGAVHRYTRTLREVVPAHAEQILAEAAWPALVSTLAAAQSAGHDPAAVLHQAAQQRTLEDAKSASEVLIWRIQRLGQRHAPSPGARAAQAASPHYRPTPQQPRTGAHAADTPPSSRSGRSR